MRAIALYLRYDRSSARATCELGCRRCMVNPAVEQREGMFTRLELTAVRDQLDSLLDEASRRTLNLREALTLL